MAPHSSSDILNGFEKTSDNANSFILRKGVNNIFIYYAGRAENEAFLWFLFWFFCVLSSFSCLEECCKAAEMFRGVRNFTCLFIRLREYR